MFSKANLESTEFQSTFTINCIVFSNILQILTLFSNQNSTKIRLIANNVFSISQLVLLILFTVYLMKIDLDPNMHITSIVGLSIYLTIKGLINAFHQASIHQSRFRKILRFLETVVASHCLSVVILQMNDITAKAQKIYLQVLIPFFFFLFFFILSKIKILVTQNLQGITLPKKIQKFFSG